MKNNQIITEQEQQHKEPNPVLMYKYVDSLEKWEVREPLLQTGWIQERLWYADFKFRTVDYKLVGIERKTIADLFASFGKRIETQLEAMCDKYDFRILLLEGSMSRLSSDGTILTNKGVEHYGWSAVFNFLRTWQDRGSTIEWTTSLKHTILRLNELYAYYQKPAHTGGINRSIAGDDRLLAFPKGVGLKTAKSILEHYGSLRNVANTTIDNLCKVDGVGKKRAEWIVVYYNKDADKAKIPEQKELI